MPKPHSLFRWLVAGFVMLSGALPVFADELTPLEVLGKQLFFDASLSSPAGESCATCHAPETGFSGPSSAINAAGSVYPGAMPNRFGNRKPPSVAYASFSPKFFRNPEDETYQGGQFWDGRADTMVEQAKGPFLNPLEMNNRDGAEVAAKVLSNRRQYGHLFSAAFGSAALTEADPEVTFDQIARAIAAYESSPEVNSFSSKYDRFLSGDVQLTEQERRGLELFRGMANCFACHPCDKGEDGSPPLFTDFTYDNVGAPANSRNPFYKMQAEFNPEGTRYRDLGVGGRLNETADWGKVKVPTLRNVTKRPQPEFVKAYLHNGHFKSVKEVVHFYNARDAHPDEFAPPDVKENVNTDELGDLGLSDAEEDDIVAFLETLSDGYGQEPTEPTSPHAPPSTVLQNSFRSIRDIVRVRLFERREQHQVARPDRVQPASHEAPARAF